MSTSLTVVYGARRFKVPVTPSTLLSQVRDEVCSSQSGLGLASAQHGLARQGKPLDLTLPLRFAGLVNNAHVDLVKLNTSTQAPVRVKVRIPGGSDFVGTFPGGATVGDVAAAAGLPDMPLALGGGTRADPSGELRSLGGGAGGLLFTAIKPDAARVRASRADAKSNSSANANANARAGPGAVAAGSPSGSSASDSKSASSEPDSRQPLARPATTQRDAVVLTDPRHAAAADDGEPPEMGVSQFRTYYTHLKAQAEPAMVSRETRERMRTEKRKQVEATTIRVRLPDQSFLEGKFQKGEHGEQVYSFVRSYLRAPGHAFALKSLNPTFTLAPEHHLLDDCHFGSRALLIFEWRSAPSSSAPILNDQAMALARPVSDESELKHASAPTATQRQQQQQQQQQDATAAEDAPETRKRDALKKAVPKWMRLHKS